MSIRASPEPPLPDFSRPGSALAVALGTAGAAAAAESNAGPGTGPPTPPGSLPTPGVRRDVWGVPPPQSQTTGGAGARIGAATTNAEFAMALDLQSFGLQNSQLQHALSSMLKAIVSLSEDHKVVKQQLESFQNATRDAQTALAVDIDSLNTRITADFVPRKEWTEGRYDDQRRTDRVAQNLQEFQQEQLSGMSGVLPRVAASEAKLLIHQEQLASIDERFALRSDVSNELQTLRQRTEDGQAVITKRVTTQEQEHARFRDDVSADLTSVKRDLGTTSDLAEETRAAQAKDAAQLRRHVELIDELQADLAATLRRIADVDTRAGDRVAESRRESEEMLSNFKHALLEQRKQDDERVQKMENHFMFQTASFDAVAQDHTARLRALSSELESLKSEMSSVTLAVETAAQKANAQTARDLQASTEALAHVQEDVIKLRGTVAALQRVVDGSSEDSRTALDDAVSEMRNRLKAVEGRRKADDAQFRDMLTARINDEIEAAVRESDRRRTAASQKELQSLRTRLEDHRAAHAELEERVEEAEAMCESAVETVSVLGDATADAASRARDGELVADLLGADIDTLRRMADDADSVDARRERYKRYHRTLSWSERRPQSPSRPTAPSQLPPAMNDPPAVPQRAASPVPASPLSAPAQPARVQQSAVAPSSPPASPLVRTLQEFRDKRDATSVSRASRARDPVVPREPPTRRAAVAEEDAVAGSGHAARAPAVVVGAQTEPRPEAGAGQGSRERERNVPQPNVVAAPAGQEERGGGTAPGVMPELHARQPTSGRSTSPQQVPVAANLGDSGLASSVNLPESAQHSSAARQSAPPDMQGIPASHADTLASSRALEHRALEERSSSSTVVAARQDVQRRNVSPPRPTTPRQPASEPTMAPSTPPVERVPQQQRQRAALGLEVNDAPNGHGVVVLHVEPGSVSDIAGLSAKDVIVEFDSKSIGDKGDLRAAYVAASAGETVMLGVLPGGRATAEVITLMLVL